MQIKPFNVKKFDFNKRNYLISTVIAAAALLTFILSYQFAPWFHAINTRVRLYMEAPAETKVSICWDKSQTQCLPLVPYSSTKKQIAQPGEIADVWLTELPPRPMYAVSIVFQSKTTDALFSRLEFDSLQTWFFGDGYGAGIGKVNINLDDCRLQGILIKSISNINYLSVEKDGSLEVNSVIYQGDNSGTTNWRSTVQVWGLLLSLVLFIAICVYLFPHAVNNVGSAVAIIRNEDLPWWVFVVSGGVIGIMILLVKHSGVLIDETDPIRYLYLALGRIWFDDVRLPGYPVFLGAVLAVFNNSLNRVILMQAFFLATSVMICVYTLRRWIPPIMSIVLVILCLLSPAQIYWARWILRESIFTSLILLGTTTGILHFTSNKSLSNLWLFIFSVICGVAFLVRENGILLPVALLPALVPEVIKHLKGNVDIRNRLRSTFLSSIKYVSPLIILGILYAGFSYINYIKYGYFQVERHQTSHVYFVKAIYPGNSDARSLLQPDPSVRAAVRKYDGWGIYSSYIIARDQRVGDPIYLSLFPSIITATKADGTSSNILAVADVLNKMGRTMYNLVPWQARAAGMLREYVEILSVHRLSVYSDKIAKQVSLQDLKQYLQSNRMPKKAVSSLKLYEQNVDSNGVITWYYHATQNYPWYKLLLLFGILSSIYILRWEDPVFLAPISYFLANCIFLTISYLVHPRYIENLDVLLILQSVLGISLFIRRIKLKQLNPNNKPCVASRS